MIPLFHDLSDATVLVFGGGRVGARKARRFDREARVIVVSPSFDGGDFGDAELVRAAPDSETVGGWIDRIEPALVVAATDDERVNGAVAEEARARDVLVNRADRRGGREPGSVVVPATVRDGPVVVAIGTGGTSPAVSRYLRTRFERELDGAGEMARVSAAVHADLRERGAPPDERRAVVTALVESRDLWKVLRSGDTKRKDVIDDVIDDVRSSRRGERP